MSADTLNDARKNNSLHKRVDTLNEDSKVEVIVVSKSDKNLTKNIDAKDDSLRKRTSLIIVPQKNSPNDFDNNLVHNNSSSTIEADNCNELVNDDEKTMEKSTTKFLESSICSNHSTTVEEYLHERNNKLDNQNENKCSQRNSMVSVDSCVSRSNSSATTTSSSTTSSKSSSSGDDILLDDDYQDLENGNILDDLEAERKNCVSNASSCIDDYSLRQKYENYVNAKAQDAVNGGNSTDADEGNIDDGEEEDDDDEVAVKKTILREHNEGLDDVDAQPRSLPTCAALLSPQEAPMGRRYAEVAQFKGNKRSSDSFILTATSAAAIATHHNNAAGVLQHQNQFQANLTNNSSASTKNTHNSCSSSINNHQTNNNCSSNNNSNNNNNNNSNSNNSLNNHQRLPFCGLDSIKGSDNNGGNGIGGGSCLNDGGKNNINFDSNDHSSNTHAMGGHTNHGGGMTIIDNASEQFHSLDANDSSCCGDGQFEDDMQALLPKCSRLSRDELSQSRTSLVSSETSRGTDDSPPCDLSLVERLLLTHPVWFLPGIQRSGAVHFLQGQEEGVSGKNKNNYEKKIL